MASPAWVRRVLLPLLDRLFSGKVSALALAAGTAAYQRGDQPAARRFIRIASRAAPGDAEVRDRAATAASEAGDHRSALDMLESAVRLDPGNGEFALRAALAECALGDEERAALRCEEAIGRITDRDSVYRLMQLLSMLRMPGPPYSAVLKSIQDWLRPRTYVEIGVATGDSLALVAPGSRVIGIDPAPRIDRPLPPGIAIYAETSDDFFAQHDLRDLLGGLPVDLAFIDGMHLFEFALRDFINLERHCDPGATILMDDCCPLDRRCAARERSTHLWSGDVWRLVPALRKYRPGLRIHTIATAPAGLCVIRGLDPASRVLSDNYDAVVGEFGALDYGVLEADRTAVLNIIPNDWQRIRELLR